MIHQLCTSTLGSCRTPAGRCSCLAIASVLSSHFIRDLLQWPLALPSDGLIDVVVQEPTSMSSLIGQMGAAPQGAHYWSNTVSEETYSLTDPDPILHTSYPHSNTSSKSTRTGSRHLSRAFSRSMVNNSHALTFKSRFIREWVRF